MPAGSPVPAPPSATKRMILVTGAGRSGTSTVAGTLHYLGFHVPEPLMQGNESNPRGFFESWWPVRFHKRVMKAANIEQTDSRPEAYELMQAAVTDEHRSDLAAWLEEVAEKADEVVVKDPRAVWLPELWVELAAAQGFEISFLTMLRHPAEVIGSRKASYANWRPGMDDWGYAVWNLCGWITSNLLVERHTRPWRRSFVRYTDLLGDWRTTMRRVREDQGLVFNHDLAEGNPHEVDAFIDGDLRRHEPSWDAWDLPPELVSLADGTFDALSRLADAGGHDDGIEAELDALAERYAALYQISRAIAYDVGTARAAEGKQKGIEEERARVAERQAAREAAREAARRQQQEQRAAGVRGKAGRVLDRYPTLRRTRERLRRR